MEYFIRLHMPILKRGKFARKMDFIGKEKWERIKRIPSDRSFISRKLRTIDPKSLPSFQIEQKLSTTFVYLQIWNPVCIQAFTKKLDQKSKNTSFDVCQWFNADLSIKFVYSAYNIQNVHSTKIIACKIAVLHQNLCWSAAHFISIRRLLFFQRFHPRKRIIFTQLL